MADQNQNAAPQQFTVPEGDRFLFIRIDADGKMQVVHSGDLLSTHGLIEVAKTYLAHELQNALQFALGKAAESAPAVAAATLADLAALGKKPS